MSATMNIKLLSPAKPLAECEAVSVLIPGTMGYMEVLASHAPMVAEIDVGKLLIKKEGGDELSFFVSGGYVDVGPKSVTVLVDVAEAGGDIDRSRAESALKRANDRLIDIHQMDIDMARARYAQKRASARLDISSGQP